MDPLHSRLAQIRRERGLSLNKLTDLCGFSTGYVSRLERGERSQLESQTCDLLAAGLRVALPYLRFGTAPQADAISRFELAGAPPALSGAVRLRMIRGERRPELVSLASRALESRFAFTPRKAPPSILDWDAQLAAVASDDARPNYDALLEGVPEGIAKAALELIYADGQPGGDLKARPAEVVDAAYTLAAEHDKSALERPLLAWVRTLEATILRARSSRSFTGGDGELVVERIGIVDDRVCPARSAALTWARMLGCSEDAIDAVLALPQNNAGPELWQARVLFEDARLAARRARTLRSSATVKRR